MKGSSSYDGKISGNRQLVDRYNESKGKGGGKLPQRPHATGGESGGAREASGHDEIKKVVGEHGPAHLHVIMHRGDGHPDGKYHSVTHHEDGHIHHADHDTIEDAHTHGAHAMGDTEHLGDMDQDDSRVAEEESNVEQDRGGSSGTSRVGFMA